MNKHANELIESQLIVDTGAKASNRDKDLF